MQPSMHWCRCALPQTHRLWVRVSTVCPRLSCTAVQGSSKKRSRLGTTIFDGLPLKL